MVVICRLILDYSTYLNCYLIRLNIYCHSIMWRSCQTQKKYCQISPIIIVKQKTHQNDTKFVFSSSPISWLLKNQYLYNCAIIRLKQLPYLQEGFGYYIYIKTIICHHIIIRKNYTNVNKCIAYCKYQIYTLIQLLELSCLEISTIKTTRRTTPIFSKESINSKVSQIKR